VNDPRRPHPLREISDGVVWYSEGDDRTKHEGQVELFPDWVRLGGSIPTWVPREKIEEVHER
jgi:hypothetical protein